MFSKISTGLVAFLAAASAVNGLVVPQSLSGLDVTDSTSTSLTLAVNVDLAVAQEDAGRTIDFTFGNADGSLTFGSGTLVIPATVPESGLLTVAATGVYSPATDPAKVAGEALLSNYAANLAGAVSVSAADGVFTNVPLAAPGVEIVQKLFLYLSVSTIVAGSGPVNLQLYNAFSVPLTFVSLNASAVTPLVNNVPTKFGQITQSPLPTSIVVPAKTVLRTGNITAAVTLTLAQGLNLISRLTGGRSVDVTSNATAAVLVGNYPSVVTLTNKVIPAVQA